MKAHPFVAAVAALVLGTSTSRIFCCAADPTERTWATTKLSSAQRKVDKVDETGLGRMPMFGTCDVYDAMSPLLLT